MSSTRLARIVPALNAEIDAGQLPGAVVAVARHGRLVFHEAVGHLGPDRRAPMPLDALFAIASMTKPVTGVAGLLLWEEGRLGLGDPIERFLPQLGSRRVAVLNERVLAGRRSWNGSRPRHCCINPAPSRTTGLPSTSLA
jgi:CubicO group peptidase (beta-lactamase class C family)